MTREEWAKVLSRITAQQPLDLDAEIFDAGSAAQAQPPAMKRDRAPSPRLWSPGESGSSYIGVRVTEPLGDDLQVAFRLAAAAIERNVIPIILTPLPSCGLERFGFRVERLSGPDAASMEQCEADLVSFWNLAIVIDAADVAALQ